MYLQAQSLRRTCNNGVRQIPQRRGELTYRCNSEGRPGILPPL
jgi:hypothetical protein